MYSGTFNTQSCATLAFAGQVDGRGREAPGSAVDSLDFTDGITDTLNDTQNVSEPDTNGGGKHGDLDPWRSLKTI